MSRRDFTPQLKQNLGDSSFRAVAGTYPSPQAVDGTPRRVGAMHRQENSHGRYAYFPYSIRGENGSAWRSGEKRASPSVMGSGGSAKRWRHLQTIDQEKNFDLNALTEYKALIQRLEKEKEGASKTPLTPSTPSMSILPTTISSPSLISKMAQLKDIINGFPKGDGSPRSTTSPVASASPPPLIDLTTTTVAEKAHSEPIPKSSALPTSSAAILSPTRRLSMSCLFLPSDQRRCSMDFAESRWRGERYNDQLARRRQELEYLEKENRERSSSRLGRQIFDEELMRQKVGLERLILEPRPRERDDFPDLPDEAVELIDRIWDVHADRGEVFSKGFDVEITRKDLLTLYQQEWLNDEIINFYMQLIMRRNAEEQMPKVYAFSTFFYPNLCNRGYASVKRWTRKVDIFAHEILIVPVHLTAHWCLAVVDLKLKQVEYYDSLGGDNPRCLALLKDYLQQESQDKRKQDFDLSEWTVVCRKNIPRQQNGSDCGMFACKFAEYASRRAAINFTQAHMPYFRQRMVWEICMQQLMM